MPLHDPAHAFVPYPDVPVPHAATGPLSGLRFGVKDLFDVAGYPTGGGSPFLLAMSGIKATTAPTAVAAVEAPPPPPPLPSSPSPPSPPAKLAV